MERKLFLICSAVLLFLIVLVPSFSVNRVQNKEILDELKRLTENTGEISKVELKETDRLYLAVEYSLNQPIAPNLRDSIFIETQRYILSDEVRHNLIQELNTPDPRMFTEGFSIRFHYQESGGQDRYWIYSLTDREEIGGPRWDVIGPRGDGSHGVIATWYPETDGPILDSAIQRLNDLVVEPNSNSSTLNK